MPTLRAQLITQSEEAFRGNAWHGPSVWPTLTKLHWEEALAPSPFEGYTAWGVVLHMAYWKHLATVRLAKASGGAVSSPGRLFRGPADWPLVPDPASGPGWLEDLVQLDLVHRRWVAALEAFPDDLWDQAVNARGRTVASTAFGVPAHDLYHIAQIRNMGVKRF